jgi:hypothetical protein
VILAYLIAFSTPFYSHSGGVESLEFHLIILVAESIGNTRSGDAATELVDVVVDAEESAKSLDQLR